MCYKGWSLCYNTRSFPSLGAISVRGLPLMADKDSRTAIIVAIVGAAAVVSSAVITNYPKLVGNSNSNSPSSQAATTPSPFLSPTNASPSPADPSPTPSAELTPASSSKPSLEPGPVRPNGVGDEKLAHLLPTLPQAIEPDDSSAN